jgi:hypothetical protein
LRIGQKPGWIGGEIMERLARDTDHAVHRG